MEAFARSPNSPIYDARIPFLVVPVGKWRNHSPGPFISPSLLERCEPWDPIQYSFLHREHQKKGVPSRGLGAYEDPIISLSRALRSGWLHREQRFIRSLGRMRPSDISCCTWLSTSSVNIQIAPSPPRRASSLSLVRRIRYSLFARSRRSVSSRRFPS